MHAVSCNFDNMNSSTLSQVSYTLSPHYPSWTPEFLSLKQVFSPFHLAKLLSGFVFSNFNFKKF